MLTSRSAAESRVTSLAADQDLTVARHLEPGDQAQRRGLAATRRPEQRHELAGLDDERHASTAVTMP